MSSPFKKRVLIIDGNDLYRESFFYLINSSAVLTAVAKCSSLDEGLTKLKSTKPSLILFDLELGGADAIEFIRKVRAYRLQTEVLVISSRIELTTAVQVFKAGASGLMLREEDSSLVVDGLEKIVSGGAALSPQVARIVVQSFHRNPLNPLSERQLQILSELSNGKSSRQISKEYRLSIETVKKHMQNIYAKFNVTRKSDAINFAIKNRFVIN